MRISGTNQQSSSLNLLGDLSSSGEHKSSLVFVYPILFDKTLIKKWESVIRDFQTAQFISQIKISNVLNITQSAVQGYGKNIKSNYINPAEVLNNALSSNSSDNFDRSLQNQLQKLQIDQFERQSQQNNTPSQSEYAYKLNQYINFIKNQVQTDPRYDNLRPAFSIITVENNLLDIPLIVGTKTYKINTGALYWILFVSLSNNQTNLSNVDRISTIIKNIPKNDYVKLMTDASVIKTPREKDETQLDKTYKLLSSEVNQAINKAIKDFKTVASNLNDFENDIGFSIGVSDDRSTFSSVIAGSIAEQTELKNKVNSLVNQTIISSVFPVIQTTNNIVANPAIEHDFQSKYRTLLNGINATINPIITNLLTIITSKLSQREYVDSFISVIQRNCESLKNINPYNSLNALNSASLRFSNIRRDANFGDNLNVVDFAEILSGESNKLYSHMDSLTSMLDDIVNSNDISNQRDRLINQIENQITDYFYDQRNPDNSIVNLNPPENAQFSNLFRQLFSGTNNNELIRFIKNIIKSLANIIAFIVFYSLLSYFCEFINIVQTKIDIAKKDVIKFPNYTLVIPIDYVKTLYFAIAARNITQTLNNIQTTEFEKFKLTESNVHRIVDAVIDRLGVSNIIIIDDARNEIYYRWSYLKRTLKLNQSSIMNYIRSQRDITSAF